MAKKKKPSEACVLCGSSNWCDCEWDQPLSITQQEWARKEEAKRARRARRRIVEQEEEEEEEE